MTVAEFRAKWLPSREPVLQMQNAGDRMALSIVHGSIVNLSPIGLRQWAKLMIEAADQIEQAPGRPVSSVRCVPRLLLRRGLQR